MPITKTLIIDQQAFLGYNAYVFNPSNSNAGAAMFPMWLLRKLLHETTFLLPVIMVK